MKNQILKPIKKINRLFFLLTLLAGLFSAFSAMAGEKTVVVKKGDTLQKISNDLFGTTKKWYKIFSMNKSILKSPDVIEEGQILTVPDFIAPVAAIKPQAIEQKNTQPPQLTLSAEAKVKVKIKKVYSAVETEDNEAVIDANKNFADNPSLTQRSVAEAQPQQQAPEFESGPMLPTKKSDISRFDTFAF